MQRDLRSFPRLRLPSSHFSRFELRCGGFRSGSDDLHECGRVRLGSAGGAGMRGGRAGRAAIPSGSEIPGLAR